tara:strand:- start:440 stop:814 length:375 start_codon:yes stop_codon:yes gene_type:complete
MKKLLLEKWNEFKSINELVTRRAQSYESHSEVPLYIADCILRYNREVKSQADILTFARAIEGVTIITVIEPARRLGEMEVMRIKIKYTPMPKSLNVDQYTSLLERTFNGIDGVLSLDMLRAVPA